MKKNDGSYLESLVHMIERSLSPEDSITQNVRLPILASTGGAKAECDIVIRSGRPPRETMTIVEVQDRATPVKIGEFRNWFEKMKSVGAQHLICVSKHPFPKSIKEQAALKGQAVRLLTLCRFDDGQIPLNFFDCVFKHNEVDVPSIRKIETVFPLIDKITEKPLYDRVMLDLARIETNDMRFTFDKRNLHALSTICIKHQPAGKETVLQSFILSLGFQHQPEFYFYSNGLFFQLSLKIVYSYYLKEIIIPFSVLSYDQDQHGTLAWVIEANYHSSRDFISIRVPVIKNGNNFILSGMEILTSKPGEVILYIEKESAKK